MLLRSWYVTKSKYTEVCIYTHLAGKRDLGAVSVRKLLPTVTAHFLACSWATVSIWTLFTSAINSSCLSNINYTPKSLFYADIWPHSSNMMILHDDSAPNIGSNLKYGFF